MMRGETSKKIFSALVAAGAALLLLYSAREFGSAWYAERLARRGAAAFDREDVAGAEKFFRSAVRIGPKHAGAWLGLGAAARERGKYEEALAAYGKAMTLTRDPGARGAARLGMAAIYADTGVPSPPRKKDWYSKAMDIYELLVKEEPENPEYHLLLAFAAMNAANPGLGLSEMRKASELAKGPEWRWVHTRLMGFYQGANLIADAEREIKMLEGTAGGGEPAAPEENGPAAGEAGPAQGPEEK